MKVFLIYLSAIFMTDAKEDIAMNSNISSPNSEAVGFLCGDGSWISEGKLCNGVGDCNDTFITDECNCASMDDKARARCEKWAIMQYVFPGVIEKGNKQKQEILECILKDRLINCSSHLDGIQCDTGGLCITASSFCDNHPCCPDKADEQHIGFGLKCQVEGGVRANDCLLPRVHLHDVGEQCLNGAENCRVLDDDGNWTGQLKAHCFECINKEHVILSDHVCDGVLDCSDFSDECLCSTVRTPEVCRIMYDENTRVEDECRKGTAGDVSCGDGTCISKSLVCDKKNDCYNGIDETYCYSKKRQRQLTSISIKKPKIFCPVIDLYQNITVITEATMCDGTPECDSYEDECVEECFLNDTTTPAFCKFDMGCVLGHIACNGIKESQKLPECNYTYVAIEEENCLYRFYCSADNGTYVSIDESMVCDGIVDCDDGSDEAKDRNCNDLDGRFYCEMSNTSSYASSDVNRGVLFVPRYKISDGIADCGDGSDECPKHPSDYQAFSSNTEMIRWIWLRIVLWIIAIVSVAGNLTVLIFSFAKMRNFKKYCRISTAFTCHHVLVFNLSVADLLMGIYLLGIAIQSSIYSGDYCSVDRKWRLGSTCIGLGIISLISSEVSVYHMMVTAAFRYITVSDPLFTRFTSSAVNKVRILTITGWIVFVLAAIIPVIPPFSQYFRSQAFVKNPIFILSEVTTNDLTSAAQKIKTASHRGYIPDVKYHSADTIPAIENTLSQIFPRDGDFQWLSVYGKSSICLPGLFRTIYENGWEYCLVLILFNLFAFCCMIICYIGLFRATKQSQQSVRSDAPEVIEYKLMKRVTTILITDFLCWMPICIMFFLYLTETLTDPIAFAICGIILLPINSALNPIIYSGLLDILAEMFQCTLRRRKSMSRSGTSSTTLKPLKHSSTLDRSLPEHA